MRYVLPNMEHIQFEVRDNAHGFFIYAYNMHNYYVRVLTHVVAESMNITLPEGYRPIQRTKEAAEQLLDETARINGWESLVIV